MWTPARASTPRASIVHRFAPSSPAGHVNGPTSSSVARPHCSPTLRPTRKCDQRCTRPIDAIHTPTSSTCDFVRLPSASSLRPCGRCLVRFTSLHALQRSARAPCRRFSLPHRGVTSKIVFERLTSDTPVASLVGSPRSRDGGLQLGQDRFPRPPREERTASTTRDVFHRGRCRKTRDATLSSHARLPRKRSRGFATAIRLPTPFRPARSPALG
jgi:hypothetical protein